MPAVLRAAVSAACAVAAKASFLRIDPTPGHPDIDPAMKQRTMDNLKAWAQTADNPTMVLMGDSTMVLLSKAMREMFADIEERSGAHLWPAEAVSFLGDASCPHTIEGVYTAQFGGDLGITMHRIELHSRLPDDTGCFDHCLVKAVQALKPGVVVWNFGIHMMHIYPTARKCVVEPGVRNYHNCGNYSDMVRESASMLMEASSQLVWRTTNAICEEKYIPKFHDAIAVWHDTAKRAELEEQCQKECQLGEGRSCLAELADARGAELEREWSLNSVAAVSSDIKVLDAYEITNGRCDKTPDGVHFEPLSYEELERLAEVLATADTTIPSVPATPDTTSPSASRKRWGSWPKFWR